MSLLAEADDSLNITLKTEAGGLLASNVFVAAKVAGTIAVRGARLAAILYRCVYLYISTHATVCL